jgi:hypothetical protein
MELKSVNNKVVRFACFIAGTFAAFLTPDFETSPFRNHNWVASIITFQIDHMRLLLAVTLAWLVYWIFKKRVKGPEAMIMFCGMGYVSCRLLLSLRALAL